MLLHLIFVTLEDIIKHIRCWNKLFRKKCSRDQHIKLCTFVIFRSQTVACEVTHKGTCNISGNAMQCYQSSTTLRNLLDLFKESLVSYLHGGVSCHRNCVTMVYFTSGHLFLGQAVYPVQEDRIFLENVYPCTHFLVNIFSFHTRSDPLDPDKM